MVLVDPAPGFGGPNFGGFFVGREWDFASLAGPTDMEEGVTRSLADVGWGPKSTLGLEWDFPVGGTSAGFAGKRRAAVISCLLICTSVGLGSCRPVGFFLSYVSFNVFASSQNEASLSALLAFIQPWANSHTNRVSVNSRNMSGLGLFS